MFTETEWKPFYEDARAYRKTACGAVRRPRVFTPEIMLNIIGMAIEKYLMAVFIRHGVLPSNHTMHDLVESLDGVASLDAETCDTMRAMDDFQQICVLDDIRTRTPEPEDIARFLRALDRVSALAEGELAPCGT